MTPKKVKFLFQKIYKINGFIFYHVFIIHIYCQQRTAEEGERGTSSSSSKKRRVGSGHWKTPTKTPRKSPNMPKITSTAFYVSIVLKVFQMLLFILLYQWNLQAFFFREVQNHARPILMPPNLAHPILVPLDPALPKVLPLYPALPRVLPLYPALPRVLPLFLSYPDLHLFTPRRVQLGF